MSLSPMMQHYFKMKEKNKDCILFFRLGDFYEMFFDDAITVSRELDITLTGKDCGLEQRAPMCGIPYHACENYLNKLINKGYKVAICEQLSEPQKGKLVERDVVRIVTKGTVFEESMLEERQNNYISAVYASEKAIGFAFCDITTGEFQTTEFTENKEQKLADILCRISPSEIIGNEFAVEISKNLMPVKNGDVPKFYKYDNVNFEKNNCEKVLKKQFGDNFTQVYEISKMQNAVFASGALISYIIDTQKRELNHISKILKIKTDDFMILDLNTRKNLEITETIRDRKKRGSLLHVLDQTKTSMGGRKFKNWLDQPLQNSTEINLRLDAVEELYTKIILRDKLSQLLSKINDIERITGRISFGSINPRDCISLKNSIYVIPEILKLLADCKSKKLKNIFENLNNFIDLQKILNDSICEEPPLLISAGGYIKDGFSAELDELRSAQKHGAEWIVRLEAEERKETNIKGLHIGFNRVFGYFIEVNKPSINNVPLRYQRKQTVANNERYITEELKKIEDKILGAEEQSIKLEQQIFAQIKQILIKEMDNLLKTSFCISELDCLLSLAQDAIKNNYIKPKISNNIDQIKIIDGRHPVVESILGDGNFVGNDTVLNNTTDKILIITGPNMAGKSTYMRQVAVITLMAHIGSFVPAKIAEFPIVDRIFTRVGASDDLAFGQSTFMVEMSEVAGILANATSKSLVVLDEIGRGTSTLDGLSIAWAVVEHLSKTMQCKTLFATHYHELTELEGQLEGVKNYKINVKEINGDIIFLRKIVRGGANKSFGVEVASLAGLPKNVINRAKELTNSLESSNLALMSLNQEQTQTSAEKVKRSTEILGVLNDINVNLLTPLSAFEILIDLVGKVK
ncbi:MAG: DNA mismatch repair protein MutS [Clostridia bacterium]